MTGATVRRWLVGLVVVVGLLVGLDRAAAAFAAHEVAVAISNRTDACTQPDVGIGGFPFLTQAIAGHYDSVTIDTSCESGLLDPVHVHLQGATVSLGSIIHRNVQRVPVRRATGTVTIPYGRLQDKIGSQSITVGPGPHRTIAVTGTLTVAGQSVTARGTGSVSYSDGGLHISVRSVTTPVGSIDPGGAFDVTVPLGGLPFHLTAAAVSAGPAGVDVTATAHDLVLQK